MNRNVLKVKSVKRKPLKPSIKKKKKKKTNQLVDNTNLLNV